MMRLLMDSGAAWIVCGVLLVIRCPSIDKYIYMLDTRPVLDQVATRLTTVVTIGLMELYSIQEPRPEACGDNRIIRNETEFKFMNDSPCDGKPRRQKGSETSCHSRLADRMELIEWQEGDQLEGERERPLRAKELY
ncbi:hypothetical protein KQX54_001659 [Cotesia glomerata]|uniref:Uncharacterized protein n=1 Tax=Cotesia glomerata TaxID=32391 RepID=A0AAV7IWL6_COTGL|nr:hypothetical protein KQX54_001659 [Cotesia glomerata]